MRSDLLVKEPNTSDVRSPLPSPGQMDEAIAREAARKEKANFKFVDPTEIDKADRVEVFTAVRDIFGTPSAPTVEPNEKDDENKQLFDASVGAALPVLNLNDDDLDAMQLDAYTLREGSQLYRRHCLHCHGLAGDGRGPTAPWVNPHPRDYRQGVFKFVSTNLSLPYRKPRRADLYRTIEKGIDGTSMPAFGLLPQKELDALVSYVIHLAIRGEVEYQTLWTLKNNRNDVIENGIKDYTYKQAGTILARWAAANARKANEPPPYPFDDKDKAAVEASIRRGHQLFIGKGICITCHYDYGRQAAYRYDHWGTFVRPRNLTDPSYRGGRRPIDIFWRISGGIEPSGMSGLAKGAIKDEEFWDLVNFVQHMPYPAMLPEDVRKKVYPDESATRSSVAQVNR
jgi:mono/diheme cytochrome c family protein